MMRNTTIAAILGALLLACFTTLLCVGKISEAIYAGLLLISAIVCIVVYLAPRLKEFVISFKEARVTLQEIKHEKEELEKKKEELAGMYGGIENLKKHPYVLDEVKQAALGLGSAHIVSGSASMRYPAGIVKRERERLARVFVNESPKIAAAILDGSMDDKVFKWNGPESPLDDPPKSVEDRKQKSADQPS